MQEAASRELRHRVNMVDRATHALLSEAKTLNASRMETLHQLWNECTLPLTTP